MYNKLLFQMSKKMKMRAMEMQIDDEIEKGFHKDMENKCRKQVEREIGHKMPRDVFQALFSHAVKRAGGLDKLVAECEESEEEEENETSAAEEASTAEEEETSTEEEEQEEVTEPAKEKKRKIE